MASVSDRIGLPSPVSTFFDFVLSSHFRAVALLLAVAFVAFFPGQHSIPPIDRDEPRYAQATKQMMETGNYVDIRYQDVPRYLQPAGVYWLQAAAAKLTGTAPHAPIWVHRLPSLIAAMMVVALTYWVALPLAGPAGGLIAGLFMATSILLGMESRLAKTDAVLLVASLGAIGILARACMGWTIGVAQAAVFWVSLGAGIMVKGPLIALAVGSPIVALSIVDRSVRWLRPLRPIMGIALVVLLVAPWMIAITIASDGNFWAVAVGKSFLGKVTAGEQGHGAPPGLYLLLFWFTFWPAAGLALVTAPWVWANRRDTAVRFCLCWILPTWITFELVVTKLPHYVLPVYPAIAILMAKALMAGRMPGPVVRPLMIAGCVLYALVGIGLLYWIEGAFAPLAIVVYLAGIALFVIAMGQAKQGAAFGLVAALAGGALLMQIATFAFTIPRLQSVWLSPRLAAAILRNAPCDKPQVASAGYHEPSLVFLVGTTTKLVFPNAAAEFLNQGGCRVVLVEQPLEGAFLGRLSEIGGQAELRERIRGIKLGQVGRQDIGLYTLAGN